MSLNISLSHSRSLKVIENGTIRKLGYSFLVAFHSNCARILYHFWDIAIYWSKITIFSYPCIRRPRWWGGGSRRIIAVTFGTANTRMVWLPDDEKSVMICWAVSTEYRCVTDRQTDILRLHSIAWQKRIYLIHSTRFEYSTFDQIC